MTAHNVPTCAATSTARPWSCQSSKRGIRIRCAALEIGRNSVRPCTRPRIIKCNKSVSIFKGIKNLNNALFVYQHHVTYSTWRQLFYLIEYPLDSNSTAITHQSLCTLLLIWKPASGILIFLVNAMTLNFSPIWPGNNN